MKKIINYFLILVGVVFLIDIIIAVSNYGLGTQHTLMGLIIPFAAYIAFKFIVGVLLIRHGVLYLKSVSEN